MRFAVESFKYNQTGIITKLHSLPKSVCCQTFCLTQFSKRSPYSNSYLIRRYFGRDYASYHIVLKSLRQHKDRAIVSMISKKTQIQQISEGFWRGYPGVRREFKRFSGEFLRVYEKLLRISRGFFFVSFKAFFGVSESFSFRV